MQRTSSFVGTCQLDFLLMSSNPTPLRISVLDGDVWRPTPSEYELACTHAVYHHVTMDLWINLCTLITANSASFSCNPKSIRGSFLLTPSQALCFSIYFSIGCSHEHAQNTHRMPALGVCTMMMIAFITIKSNLVPLIEGLCAQI